MGETPPLCNIVINQEDPSPPHLILRNIWTAPYDDDDGDDVGWKGQMVGSKSGNYLETAEKPVKNYPTTELQMN